MRFSNCLFFICLLIACAEPAADTSGTSASTEPTASSVPKVSKDVTNIPRGTNQIVAKIKQQQKCKVNGELLEENELWLKDQGKLICILADSSTYDPNFGMSHRILEVFDTYTCEVELKLTLPVNISPDFAYYLADINYNNGSKIVAIKAAKTIYCLSLVTKKMLPLLTPKFKTKRPTADAASGTIIRLELWENFLVGFAQDKGTFVFDLDENGQAKPILPFAEFQLGDTRFNSLFLLPSGENKYQAILPDYDWDEEVFSINPLFEAPTDINTDIQKSALDNQFLVLRQSKENRAILVDMKARKNKLLPTSLIKKSTKDILAWAKTN